MALPKFKSEVFLAPMAGITDSAFRIMCLKRGAGLVFTELTSIHAINAKQKKGEKELLEFVSYSKKEKKEGKVGIQLFGNEIKKTKEAAEIVSPYFDIIDFNIGCPAAHITAQMAGAALLQKPEHMEKLLSSLVSSTNKPVSIKLRSGVKKDDRLFLKIAKIGENAGVSMITLHPRTVEQGYSGVSDWKKIAELKSKVSCPVVGNGDIKKPEDTKRMFDETGCDYVMIGRAAAGNPEIFSQTNEFLKLEKYNETTEKEKRKNFFEYAKLAEEFNIKFSDIKNQAMYFSKGIVGGTEMRGRIAKTKNIEEIKDIFS